MHDDFLAKFERELIGVDIKFRRATKDVPAGSKWSGAKMVQIDIDLDINLLPFHVFRKYFRG